jgi:anti-anti-sigma regulatory factor
VDIEADYAAAMNTCLDALGRALEVDRAYVFEAHADPRSGEALISQRFEWSRATVDPQIDNPEMENLPLGFFDGWEATFRRGESIAFLVAEHPQAEVREMMEGQAIVALLLVPITLRGEFWGFIGFDDCTRPRRWRDVEVLALTAIAGSIGGAIERSRTYRTMLAISSPVLKVWEGALVVPLVGRLTSDRAHLLTDELLAAITRLSADDVLLDITGMSAIDPAELARLLATIRAAALLGARCTLVGTSPAVARSLVEADLDVRGLDVRARLEDGLADVLARRGLAVVKREQPY